MKLLFIYVFPLKLAAQDISGEEGRFASLFQHLHLLERRTKSIEVRIKR